MATAALDPVTEMQAPFLPDHVIAQKEAIPSIYGAIDFTRMPERFSTDLSDKVEMPERFLDLRAELLSDREKFETIRAYTMTGDRVADAYAALMPQYGFRALVDMLELACEKGIEAVENAPPELAAFIAAMEANPAWLDMEMVEEGARQERNGHVHLTPFVLRGAFIATFMNKYSALPMALTGTLSNGTAARRAYETGSFFTSTLMPGALGRFGAGFKAAAKVRLMHSMVRANIARSGKWDASVYGVPIPQVDQMPAGLIGTYLMAREVLDSGREEFTPQERARVELARYRCFLLGLPEDLLGETPREIERLWLLRQATLRAEFEPETCGALLRATMAADMSQGDGLSGKIRDWMESGFSKLFFINHFMAGNRQLAASVGVTMNASDKLAGICALLFVQGQIKFYKILDAIPGVRGWAGRRLVKKLARMLEAYGHADFITDASQYRPAV
ncbi:oxygenase MpaB family protein [Altererythrobacter litoralis]|uniref:Oxygenase MpaB family protein n=1 Tax=Altererythrobacter litoralis TaxID=3113904 RepID=A0ABU7GGF5_9SPHN|nr:oxygenase MpaB family protein [Erythrobacteraceae bacterium 1XM1-14]